MRSRRREPRLEEMLADPLVKAVMKADIVDPRELEAELRRTAALMRMTRRTLKSGKFELQNRLKEGAN